jgi:lysophospholipase L1-like esterase
MRVRTPGPVLPLSLLAAALLTALVGLAVTPSSGATPAAPPAAASRFTSTLGLGDSVPAGFACGCMPYVGLLSAQHGAAQHQPMTVQNLARGGLTSAGLLQQVASRGVVAGPGAVTVITIGANDFDSGSLSSPGCRAADGLACYAPQLEALDDHVRRTLRLLGSAGERRGPVLVTGYWNVFLDGPRAQAKGPAYTRDSDVLTRQVNDVLERAAGDSGATYVDLYAPFKSRGEALSDLLAPDGDHPSAAGHRLIADLLEDSLTRS